jgi:hypothetical protein
MVFVDQAAENVCSSDDASLAGWTRNVSCDRRSLLESAMRAVSVVVGLLLGQDSDKLPFVEDHRLAATSQQNQTDQHPKHRIHEGTDHSEDHSEPRSATQPRYLSPTGSPAR